MSFRPIFVVAAVPVPYFIIRFYKTLVSIEKQEEYIYIYIYNSPRARTTPGVSFRPVVLMAALSVTHFFIRIYKYIS